TTPARSPVHTRTEAMRNTMKYSAFIVMVAIGSATALQAQSEGPVHARYTDDGVVSPAPTSSRRTVAPILIRNATVMTVTKGPLDNTDVLLENGKIARIGKGISAPAGAVTIDGTGKFVTPGIIDVHSHTMMDALNEGTRSVTSMVRVRDILNNTAPAI